jgi:hypothetical protein
MIYKFLTFASYNPDDMGSMEGPPPPLWNNVGSVIEPYFVRTKV